MRCRILGLLVLLGAVSVARADYAVFIVNLNSKPPAASENNNLGGLTTPGVGPMVGPMAIPTPGGGQTGAMPPMGGFPGMPSAEDAADEVPFLVVAVVPGTGIAHAKANKTFDANQPFWFTHKLVPGGAKIHVQKKNPLFEVVPLLDGSGKVLQSISVQFQTKYNNATTSKAGAGELRELAAWALGHGLLGLAEPEKGFIQVMDRLVTTSPTDAAAVAYRKVKADLNATLSNEDTAGLWKKRLVETYKVTQADGYHYAILHNFQTDGLHEVKTQIEELEKGFQGYFYWWALQGVALPVPKTRQVAIIADSSKGEFDRLKRQLSGSPALAGGSTARREGLVLLSARRNDGPYTALFDVSTARMWGNGYDRNLLLAPKSASSGLPPAETRGRTPDQLMAMANEPRLTAMLLKAMESEWERTSTSHQAARQLVFATGLLPRNVHVPEWLQFGVGSFFETPLQSPWGGPGAANSYWLPRFKEYWKGKANEPKTWKYGDWKNHANILSQVVTDELFRGKPGQPFPEETHLREIHLRHARAAAWSLTYFLAHRERDKLRAYFKELGRLPRDLEMDEEVLKRCFARAFDCANPDGSVNNARFKDLADRWLSFIKDVTLEAGNIHTEIRAFYEKMPKPAPPANPNTPMTPGLIGPTGTPAMTPPAGAPGTTIRPGSRRPGGI